MTVSASQSIADLGARWSVNERTIVRWRARGAPLHDDAQMVAWLGVQKHVPAGCRKKMREHRKGAAPSPAVGATDTGSANTAPAETDWQKFRREAKVANPQEAMNQVALARDFASMKFQAAAALDDEAGMKFYGDLMAKMESVLHDAVLRAKKLGLDEGELVPKPTVERFLRAFAFWAMKSVDTDLADLCKNLTGLPQVNDVRGVLEPALLSARFVKPFARAARVESPSALPEWMVATLKDAVDDYIEDGAKEFEEAAT